VHYSLALIAYHDKDLETAADELALELAAFPGDPDQGLMRGKILFEDKRFAEAAATFQVVAEGEDKPIEGRIGWAQATLEAGDANKALEILAPLLETQKDNPTCSRSSIASSRSSGAPKRRSRSTSSSSPPCRSSRSGWRARKRRPPKDTDQRCGAAGASLFIVPATSPWKNRFSISSATVHTARWKSGIRR
jgi:hypothetical protein